MNYWLVKSEGSVFSISDLGRAPKKTTGWDGVRNFEARNNMKKMRSGDQSFFYHSNSDPSGIAGICEIVREAYPDPTQFDRKNVHHDPKAHPDRPVWFQVDVRLVRVFPRIVSLDELRAIPALSTMALFKRSRLSVLSVSPAEWKAVLAAAGR